MKGKDQGKENQNLGIPSSESKATPKLSADLWQFLSQPRTMNAIAKKLKVERSVARPVVLRLVETGFVVKRSMADLRERPKYELSEAARDATQ